MKRAIQKLVAILLAIIIITDNITVGFASYGGCSVQRTGNGSGGYMASGFNTVISQTLNPNYGVYFQLGTKLTMVNDTTARVQLYTHCWIVQDIKLDYALSLGVTFNGNDYTPNNIHAGSWNGSNQYGIIVNSNSGNDSVPTNYRLGAFAPLENGTTHGANYYWDILYSFDIPVAVTDNVINMRFYKKGSGFFDLGSITSQNYTIALPDRTPPVEKKTLTVTSRTDTDNCINAVTVNVNGSAYWSGNLGDGESKSFTLDKGSSYSVTATGNDNYTTDIQLSSGTLNGDTTVTILNTRKATVSPSPGVHTHSYTWKTIKSATCTEKGSREGTCSCGDKKTEEISALGHSFIWKTTKQATTTSEGTKEYVCSRCGLVSKTEKIPKLTSSNSNGNTSSSIQPSGTGSSSSSSANQQQGNSENNAPAENKAEEQETPTVITDVKRQYMEVAIEPLTKKYKTIWWTLYTDVNADKINSIYEEAIQKVNEMVFDDEAYRMKDFKEIAEKAIEDINAVDKRTIDWKESLMALDFTDMFCVLYLLITLGMMITLILTIVREKQFIKEKKKKYNL